MTKHFCNVCGKKYIEEGLVALLTEEVDSSFDIIEEAVCPVCCNKIKEFIASVQKENGIDNKE